VRESFPGCVLLSRQKLLSRQDLFSLDCSGEGSFASQLSSPIPRTSSRASSNGRKALTSLLNKCNVASYQLMSTELCQANPPGTIDHVSMVSNRLHSAHTGHVT
jgi:hypothetical protein